jgi:drug/metabolite transporter (DMT)-like permease
MAGVVAALVAAVLFSLGGVLQHRAVAAHAVGAFDTDGMVRGVRQPMWWLGLAVQALAVLVQLVALALTALATVQTIMTTMVVWVLAFAVLLERVRPGRAEFLGSALVGAGVIGFVLATRPQVTGTEVDTTLWAVTTAACLACAVVAVGVSRTLSPGPAAAVLGGGAGLVNVLGSGLASASILLAEQSGAFAVLRSWLPYGAIAVTLASIGATVMAFAAGPATAAIPPMIAANPIAGFAFGVLLLGQSWAGGAPAAAAALVALAVTLAGIVVLARSRIVVEQFG